MDLKYEDLQKLQAVGAKAQEEQAKFILRNDLPKVWQHLKTLKNGRVDIVLDNGECKSIYELCKLTDSTQPVSRLVSTEATGSTGLIRQVFTDFILADFLVSCTPFVSEVVFQ